MFLFEVIPYPYNTLSRSCALLATEITIYVRELEINSLDFSNTVPKTSLERLAESDSSEVVREVHEFFADFLAINHDLFSLNVSYPDYEIHVDNFNTWDLKTLSRTTEGICGLLLALKKKPFIRYERNSILGRKLATEIAYSIKNEGPLFDFKKPDTPPILLIVDRKNDPLTPLLNQWTYQAMTHELIGISNGRVDLSNVLDISPEMKVTKYQIPKIHSLGNSSL